MFDRECDTMTDARSWVDYFVSRGLSASVVVLHGKHYARVETLPPILPDRYQTVTQAVSLRALDYQKEG